MSVGRTGDQPETPPILRPPVVEPPSSDLAPVAAESGIPGRHRGGFERWPTAPIGVAAESSVPGHVDPPPLVPEPLVPEPLVPEPLVPEPILLWAPREPPTPYRGFATWALGLSIAALVVSTLVGWGFALGLAGIVLAIIALRRPLENRTAAIWALVVGVVSVLYSAGWLWFAATQVDRFV